MSQVNELLSSLSEDEIAVYTVNPETEEHIVIDNDRFILVPEYLKRIAVQHDNNIETVTFDCPRYWDGIDMSTMSIYINYMRSDGITGCFLAENVAVDETDDTIMHFDWVISDNVTKSSGKLSFLVCIKETDEDGYEIRHWNSELNTDMYVSKGLECTEEIGNAYPDIIAQLLARVEGSSVGGGIQGTVTLAAADWVSGSSTKVFADLNDGDGIIFTPATRADKDAATDADIFVTAVDNNVTFTVEDTPTADITFTFFIMPGAGNTGAVDPDNPDNPDTPDTPTQLSAPTIVLNNDILTIYEISGLATSFDILSGGVVQKSIATAGVTTTFDLSALGLSTGSHYITVAAKADGYTDSKYSNAVVYTIEETLPQLPTPTISILNYPASPYLSVEGSFSMNPTFKLYADGEYKTSFTSPEYRLANLNLGIGTHPIYIIATKDGYNNSESSNVIHMVYMNVNGDFSHSYEGNSPYVSMDPEGVLTYRDDGGVIEFETTEPGSTVVSIGTYLGEGEIDADIVYCVVVMYDYDILIGDGFGISYFGNSPTIRVLLSDGDEDGATDKKGVLDWYDDGGVIEFTGISAGTATVQIVEYLGEGEYNVLESYYVKVS